MPRRLPASVVVALSLVACTHEQNAVGPPVHVLDEAAVALLVPDKVKDKEGWAQDVIAGITLAKKDATPERVCAVLAVIEQESGFDANPAVADLPKIVRTGIEAKLASLGPLAEPAMNALLEGKAPNSDASFGERIAKLHTERDLDRLFRDIASTYRKELPGPVAMLGKGALEELNPVTTAGSMQVKVSFARSLGANEALDDDSVRELLYTRGGGVRFGTARLIGYSASYDDITFRFADYNAGMYASRNAAFQQMLADLTGEQLVTDGDVLAYEKDGAPKDLETNTLKALLVFGAGHGVSASTIKGDAHKEKSEAFEKTATWRAVRDAWEAQTKRAPPYARIPDVALSSPKLSKPRTTEWYAASVKKRYDKCRARA